MPRSQARPDIGPRAGKRRRAVTREVSRLVREAALCFDTGRPLEPLLRDVTALAGAARMILLRPVAGGEFVLADSDPSGAGLSDLPVGSVQRRPIAGATLCLVGVAGDLQAERVDAAESLATLVIGLLEARARASSSSGGPARDATPLLPQADQSLRWSTFLADASRALSSSLEFDATLQRVARLALPAMADWCVVDVVEGTTVRRMAVAHADPRKAGLANELRQRYPLDPRRPEGVARMLRSGRAELETELTRDRLTAIARDADQLRIMTELGTKSALSVPMVARGRLLGGITLVYGDSGRRYAPADLPVAEDLARRAALAIDNARLYAAANETIRARDDFLSIASHELRTPVASLRLAAQGLARLGKSGRLASAPPIAVAKSLDVVDRQSERLVQLIDKLLDVSRIESGRLELDLEDVELAGLVRSVSAQAEAQLAAVGCALTVEAPEPIVGRWDSARLAHILQNLLSNAAKYGAGSSVRVSVERRGDWARLAVADRGIGIATELQSRLFERFERAVSAQHYGGLGLGLYVVRRLTEALGGRVFVSSSAGEGATFVVELPLSGPAPGSDGPDGRGVA